MSRRIKLLVSDLDGTLLNRHHILTERVKSSLSAVKEQGVLVTLVTGRMCQSALPFYQELDLDTPLIAYNGSFIKDIAKDELLLHYRLPRELAQELLAIGRKEGVSLQVYVDDFLYTEKITPYVQEYLDTDKVEAEVVPDLLPIVAQGPTKIIMLDSQEHLDLLWQKLGQKYAGQVYFTKSHPNMLECLNVTANKGTAVQFLARRYGIDKEEIMACGDHYNDLPLLEAAGLKVAVENAVPALKQVADYITCGNNEDGIAKAVEKFVLNRT